MSNAALTLKGNGILRVLTTPIDIVEGSKTNFVSVHAIWDTGATGTSITRAVAQGLGLVPTGLARVNTAAGIVEQATYTVDIRLNNGVTIQSITATEVAALAGGCDALIGMDIISLGDFSITNHNGITCMSFRVPSCHEIDYVVNPNYGVTPIKKPSYLQASSSTYARRDKKKGKR